MDKKGEKDTINKQKSLKSFEDKQFFSLFYHVSGNYLIKLTCEQQSFSSVSYSIINQLLDFEEKTLWFLR
jgi:hypothetical protein